MKRSVIRHLLMAGIGMALSASAPVAASEPSTPPVVETSVATLLHRKCNLETKGRSFEEHLGQILRALEEENEARVQVLIEGVNGSLVKEWKAKFGYSYGQALRVLCSYYGYRMVVRKDLNRLDFIEVRSGKHRPVRIARRYWLDPEVAKELGLPKDYSPEDLQKAFWEMGCMLLEVKAESDTFVILGEHQEVLKAEMLIDAAAARLRLGIDK